MPHHFAIWRISSRSSGVHRCPKVASTRVPPAADACAHTRRRMTYLLSRRPPHGCQVEPAFMFHLFHRSLNRLSKPSPRLFMPRVEVRSTWWNFVPRGEIARSGECMKRVVHVLDIHG